MFFKRKIFENNETNRLIVAPIIGDKCECLWSVQEYNKKTDNWVILASCPQKKQAELALIHLAKKFG